MVEVGGKKQIASRFKQLDQPEEKRDRVWSAGDRDEQRLISLDPGV